jgi:hypothetical protein
LTATAARGTLEAYRRGAEGTRMEITLTLALEKIVNEKAKSGQYLPASDVLRNDLEAQRDEEVVVLHRATEL